MAEQEHTRLEEPENKSDWERDLINRLAFASLVEQRRARRWSIFFKLLLFVYIGALLALSLSGPGFGERVAGLGKHVAKVEINGAIADDSRASADMIVEGLRNAFEDRNTEAVVLRINSPGGSPVQSDYVYREIGRLRAEHSDIPVYAVIVDMGASGAYYIASAADEIYANPASIVGSIGVLMNSFGFVDAMEKMGVERRLYTAGENKAFLDPFSPTEQENVVHIRAMLDDIHGQFIDAVKRGRGDRLKSEPDLFSGLVWTGRRAEELGLVDGMGDVDFVARELVGNDNVVDFTRHADFLRRFADRFGAATARVLQENVGLSGPALR